MRRTRVIPILLLQGKSLVKTSKFQDPSYVGDPINTVKIFNDKEVDEIIVLDITATEEGRSPDLAFLGDFASECFMPLCYGGGIRHIQDIEAIFKVGAEKVSINTSAIENPNLIQEAIRIFGSQSIIVSIDVKKYPMQSYRVVRTSGKIRKTEFQPVEFARKMEELGAGEILINSVDRDGTASGYDLDLIHGVADAVSVPVIACGGAGSVDDFILAAEAGASAVSGGRIFVYYGKRKAVLINYPDPKLLESLLP